MSERNKTLTLSPEEIEYYASKSTEISAKSQNIENKILMQDSIKAMDFIPDDFADLIITDPPYNLTKNFGTQTFREMKDDEYLIWLDSWISKLPRILKDNGSLYICSDWKTSVLIPLVAGKYFSLQNRISWEREKGRSCAKNWKNCLEDIWFFTKSNNYKFNLNSVKICREVIAPYRNNEGKAKDWFEKNGKKFRMTSPSNIWTDISVPFWSMSENTPHPTQKPEKLIAKLILASSDEKDMVFDPFAGSGTTCVVAKKLGRRYLGIEREKEYAAIAEKRLEIAEQDRHIQGYENGFFKPRNLG